MEYKVCNKCVMDTSDPNIKFDQRGVCNHCLEFENVTSKFKKFNFDIRGLNFHTHGFRFQIHN